MKELRFNIYRKQGAGQIPKTEEKAGQGAGQTHETDEKAGQTMGQVPKTEQDTKQARKTEQGTEQDTEQTPKTEQAQGIESFNDIELGCNEKIVFCLLKNTRGITISDIADKLGWGRSKVIYYIEKLKTKKIIKRVGTSQKGYWKVLN